MLHRSLVDTGRLCYGPCRMDNPGDSDLKPFGTLRLLTLVNPEELCQFCNII